VCPAWAHSKGLKSLICSCSGKDIAEHQADPELKQTTNNIGSGKDIAEHQGYSS